MFHIQVSISENPTLFKIIIFWWKKILKACYVKPVQQKLIDFFCHPQFY